MLDALLLSLIALWTPQPPPADPIVVEGRRDDPAGARAAVAGYVAGIGLAARTRPVARWMTAICPRAYGLSPDLARFVTVSVEAVARRSGADVAPPGCAPNIAIVFTDDGPGQVKALFKRTGGVMAEETPARRARLMTGADPVRWWYDTEVRGDDGRPMLSVPAPAIGTGEGGQPVLPSTMPILARYGSSLVSTQTARALRSVVVVIDVERASGVSLAALSSYVALVALAEIRPSDPAPAGSILRLFDEKDRYQELTRWDRAFLSSYYRLRLDRTLIEQRGSLRADMLARVDAADGAP